MPREALLLRSSCSQYPEADVDKPGYLRKDDQYRFGTGKKFFSVLTVTDEAQKHGHPTGNVEKVDFFDTVHFPVH